MEMRDGSGSFIESKLEVEDGALVNSISSSSGINSGN